MAGRSLFGELGVYVALALVHTLCAVDVQGVVFVRGGGVA